METDYVAVLKKKEDRRIRSGHLWVFSNEIERVAGQPASGDIVRVVAHGGDDLGFGFYCRNSLIAIRLLGIGEIAEIENLLLRRINEADRRRANFTESGSYRMVHGESDFLPGLIIDRYGDTLVLESFTSGIDRLLPDIVSVLDERFQPARIIEKSISVWRSYENLEKRIQVLKGNNEDFEVTVNGMIYRINPVTDQKTGLFLDQSANRLLLESHARGKSVLDCFSNVGGFALHAARGGADSVTAVDVSGHCIGRSRKNAELNNLDRIQFVESDVFDFFRDQAARYDMIVLDPPAFVKNKKSLPVGLKAYQKLNESAMRVLNDGGILVSCSCSYHVSSFVFIDMLTRAAVRQRKQLSVFAVTGAGPDHPVLLSMPETEYLTCVFAHAMDMS